MSLSVVQDNSGIASSPRALPAWVYNNADMHRLEMQRILTPSWQIVCHLSDIPHAGDYVTLDIGNESVFAVRDRDGEVRAFHNVCRHRGARIVDERGNCPGAITCPYHGWSYKHDGSLIGLPLKDTFPNLDRSTHGLKPVRVEKALGHFFTSDNLSRLRELALEEIASALKRLGRSVPVRAAVTDDIAYLTADEEDKFMVGQANTLLDEEGHFLEDRVEVRVNENFRMVAPEEVDFLDVSPKQMVSVATALIPFLEHDDANRALMGSNMQRQAVPLVRPEVPLVGTGMERRTAVDSGHVIVAEADGEVVEASGRVIVVRYDSPDLGEVRYRLTKFTRSNQGTCLNQRPLVLRGQRVALALGGVGLLVGFLIGTLYGQRQERNRRSRVRF